MKNQNVIAIFDIGKTNKKILLFDENYKVAYEDNTELTETKDEDGFPCDNLELISMFVLNSLKKILAKKEFNVKAINFTSYGATFVYIDEDGSPLTPLYNYLKPFPDELQNYFYDKYGGKEKISLETSAPIFGNLNSGLQLVRIKYQKPEIFKNIKYALHLPQYLSSLLSNQYFSDITSIGSHTTLWDFEKNDYHEWLAKENILEKLAPLVPSDYVIQTLFYGVNLQIGIGLHDSSAALIPYLLNFSEPFILISTGTWCISFNPFNHTAITSEELKLDCLCYLTFNGKAIKASRLFAGHEHENHVRRIAKYFNTQTGKYKLMNYNPDIIAKLKLKNEFSLYNNEEQNLTLKPSIFGRRNLSSFENDEEAYHQLILDLIIQQHKSTSLVKKSTNVRRIFVDGGFSNNIIYMNLLASVFPEMEIFSASIAQATAMGAALIIHSSWNNMQHPTDSIKLKYYSAVR